ncbi:MAG: hypothetical protein C5B60_12440 [Chloroflexi bacterium]|nr:MAG: hypothetical protein C5B60_12440 [Chloroflexota bacterium]
MTISSRSSSGDSVGSVNGLAHASRFRSLIFGLEPLVPLLLTVMVTLGLAWLARQITAGAGFYTQQWADGIIVVLGILGGALALAGFSARVLRQVRAWQESGLSAQAGAALWGLVAVALVVVLPVLLAIAIPQHPAPNLAP